ncbi:hypothetical protein CHS0354_027453 [Potamilus streckersoni]|uniref:Peptidase S8/S53 domain-containing protein n=1 Tax=Potamilus streckersoni TaxID=2493646 RepID=A0AAE0T7B5_9BIVA|nr:hypothetical protein CHS0354_027453 [Potamilus streckersoni]
MWQIQCDHLHFEKVWITINLSGIRLLGSKYTTDISEAQAISHGYAITHISCNSWGPPDSYGYFSPGVLTAAAFEQGVTQGRGGKGVIYVWAAGNGGTDDNCNADGYANSIYTVTISSVNSLGQPAWYSEVCASTLAVTYSRDKNQRYMVTTSNGNSCNSGIEGTSFSAPQAAGMVALALETNPNLSWRDVQHLIVLTANHENLTEAAGYGFSKNGAGNYGDTTRGSAENSSGPLCPYSSGARKQQENGHFP